MTRSDLLKECGVKKRWHEKTLKDFSNDPEALEKIENYLRDYKTFKSKGLGLFLWGENGVGKTHLLNVAFMQLLDKKQKVQIVSFQEITTAYVNSWSGGRLFNFLCKVPFLGIEEIGKEFKSVKEGTENLSVVAFDTLLRERHQTVRPTWFTSNNKPSSVKKLYSEDIASLLKEISIPINVIGADMREDILQQNKGLL